MCAKLCLYDMCFYYILFSCVMFSFAMHGIDTVNNERKMFCDGTACVVFLIADNVYRNFDWIVYIYVYFFYFPIFPNTYYDCKSSICFRWLMTSLSLENWCSLHFKFTHMLLLLHVRGITLALFLLYYIHIYLQHKRQLLILVTESCLLFTLSLVVGGTFCKGM